jgi:glycosyltransferase involved in cell wall biosynthesis
MSAPLVSVVIATYNSARFVPTAVMSVLRQTLDDLELHVIDDGSSDRTWEVLKPFASDKRFNYHYQPNRGQASAKNAGIRLSNGRFVAFLDADDFWKPSKLERQLPVFDGTDAGVVYSDVVYVDEGGRELKTRKRQYYQGWITERLFIQNFVNFNSAVAKRECFDRAGLFDESLPMAIDWDLWLRISVLYPFAYLDEATFCYRIWPGQMSRNFRTRYECVMRIMQRFLASYPGVVRPRIVRKAWADTYTNLGRCHARDGARARALLCYLRAVSRDPTYLPAWAAMGRLAVPRWRPAVARRCG